MDAEMKSWFDPEFWGRVVKDSVTWAIEAAPKLLVVCLALAVGLKLLGIGLRRLEAYLIAHQQDASAAAAGEHEKRVQTLMGIVRRVALVAAWGFFIMLFLVQLGIDIGPLIAGAGVLGLAVGFGAQELVRDVISGFFMLLENHLRTGDVAKINGQGGLVESIGLRTIRMRDLSGVVHVFQNGKIDTIANMTKEWSAMLFDVGIAYHEDTDRASEVMQAVAEEMRADDTYGEKILEAMELFGVEELADSAVVIRARLKTLPIQQWSVGREYRRRLKKAFDREGIEIPFPHRTLYWGQQRPAFRVEASGFNGHAQPDSERAPSRASGR